YARWSRYPPVADRVPPARCAARTPGESADAPAAAAGRLGTKLRRAQSLRAHLHGSATAKARDGPRAAAFSAHGNRNRLSLRARVTLFEPHAVALGGASGHAARSSSIAPESLHA